MHQISQLGSSQEGNVDAGYPHPANEFITRRVNSNSSSIVTVHEKRGNFALNVESCYDLVKFTCHIGNVLEAVVSTTNIFGTK
jgi:hypothetical protein